jgi:hypothetical protein
MPKGECQMPNVTALTNTTMTVDPRVDISHGGTLATQVSLRSMSFMGRHRCRTGYTG